MAGSNVDPGGKALVDEVRCNHVKDVERLLQLGADVHFDDDLAMACSTNLAISRLLLEHGADPTARNGVALANLATIELQENKLDEAEKHITAAVQQSPNDAYNLSTLGYLKFRREKFDEALDALSRAAQIDANNPEIQNYLGVTLSHKGQRKAAETALRRAIQLNPTYAPAHNNLAVIYLGQTPPMAELARWHYQKALDAGQPRNPDLEKMLADKGAPVTPP